MSVSAFSQTVENIDGVRVVHNEAPKWESDLKVVLELVNKIGGFDETDENYLLYRPMDVTIDRDGNIYILDSGNFTIKKYDKNGKFITAIGRKGRGPGEFQYPISIDLDKNNYIYVNDSGNNRIEIFDDNGKSFNTIPIITGSRILLLNSQNIAINVRGRYNDADNVPSYPLVRLFNLDGESILKFGKRRSYIDNNMRVKGNSYSFTADKYDTIYLAYTMQNKIEKYSPDGKLLLSIDRKLPYKESEKWENKNVLDKKGKPLVLGMFKRFSSGIQIDKYNRMWVRTLKKRADNRRTNNSGYHPERYGP